MTYTNDMWARIREHGMHSGRSWVGHQIEDECPCPKAACGLVNLMEAYPICSEHSIMASKTMRQSHVGDMCPALNEEETE